MAATLANGGICPITGERVLRTDTVQNCLSLMVSCGMYDFSGEFAFSVGLPAKSGVGGGMIVIVPNLMGLCLWSPRLDTRGNPIRCIEFCKQIVLKFNLHNYDNLSGVSEKNDPRISWTQKKAQVGELIWAASKGDHGAIHRLIVQGFDQNASDYDRRTALHLAAAEGREQVVRYLVENGAEVNPLDRWNATPLDDAYKYEHKSVIDFLLINGGTRGNSEDDENIHKDVSSDKTLKFPIKSEGTLTVELIYAASSGDIQAMRRLVAKGANLAHGDYDYRTPMHLAAAEGYENVVQYLLDQGVSKETFDRWGNTPLEDANRHGHTRIMNLLS